MSAVTGVENGMNPEARATERGQFDRARSLDSRGAANWITGRWLGLKHWLPKGQLLPEHVLRRRHRSICVLLWLHVPALFAFGMLIGGNSLL
ncbi:MAG TPA: hypothetical protein VGF91_09925, partial [Solirubrobacteraceae bacterium]